MMFLIETASFTERRPRPLFFDCIEPVATVLKIFLLGGIFGSRKFYYPTLINAFDLAKPKARSDSGENGFLDLSRHYYFWA